MSKIIIYILITLFFGGCSIKDVGRPILKYAIFDRSHINANIKTDKILKIS